MSKIKFETNVRFKGLPKIIYRNYDSNVDGKEFMENQFLHWTIQDYHRHSNKYDADNYSEWEDLILDDQLPITPEESAYCLNVIDSIVEWYDSESSEVCIFADDCVDFSVSDDWMFDWEFLTHHLPYNWDCIQLYASPNRSIKMHLHPWIDQNKSQRCCMVTRSFAKRLKKFHLIDGKYKLSYPSPNRSLLFTEFGSLDSFFYDLGITYTLPIFALNTKGEFSHTEKISSDAIRYWWENKSPVFSNFEFFHYNKGDKEWKMEVQFDSDGVYMDPMEGIMIWI